MPRTTLNLAALLAAGLLVTQPAAAERQVNSCAGLTDGAARGLTLTEIAQHKFNRDLPASDRHAVTIAQARGTADRRQLASAAGVTPDDAWAMSLGALAVAKFNNEAGRDDRQGIVRRSDTASISRSRVGDRANYRQLIASAGLTRQEAGEMTLDEIVQYKFDKDVSYADRQRVGVDP